MATMTDTTITEPDLKLHAAEEAAQQPDEDTGESRDDVASEQPDNTADRSDGKDQPTDDIGARRVVEAVLFATEAPLKASKIAEVAELKGVREVKKHIAALNASYEEAGNAFRIEEIAEGFQMMTLPEYNDWLSRLLRVRQETRLSQAGMETLAIVAYKQPILRADVEAIRGVACGEMLNRLREANLIKIVGRADDVGRPILYGTTKEFLEVFGLGSLDDLPKVEELLPPQ